MHTLPAILGVGIATLDIINTVDGYPAEDTEVRAVAQRITRGGNATNTLTVLSQLGHPCSWAGVLVEEPDSRRILAELARYAISTEHCKRSAHGKMPVSYITLNRRNGSRTIVHYRDLSEFGFDDFRVIDLSGFAWIHFEGRNVAETLGMLRHARHYAPWATRSLEVEKNRDGIEQLFPEADVLLFGKQFARARGFTQAESFLRHWRPHLSEAWLLCAWGEAGAYGCAPHSEVCLHAPAHPPPQIVDTLGAGDTFNAAVIHALSRELELNEVLDFGCRLAGAKCAREGLALEWTAWT